VLTPCCERGVSCCSPTQWSDMLQLGISDRVRWYVFILSMYFNRSLQVLSPRRKPDNRRLSVHLRWLWSFVCQHSVYTPAGQDSNFGDPESGMISPGGDIRPKCESLLEQCDRVRVCAELCLIRCKSFSCPPGPSNVKSADPVQVV
jgi:hypothetical protein